MMTKRAETKKRGPKAYKPTTFLVNFGKADKDVYKYLESKRHKSEYIRDLIKADMEANK